MKTFQQNVQFVAHPVGFTARCVARRAISPLEPGAELEVVGIAPEEECRHEMFVLTRWRPHALAIPLMQVVGMHADEATHQAIEDWRYWVNQGYVCVVSLSGSGSDERAVSFLWAEDPLPSSRSCYTMAIVSTVAKISNYPEQG